MKFMLNPILLSIVFLSLSCVNTMAQGQKPLKEIPTVSYCDLIHEPAFYDNKVIRIKATYYAAFEGSIMYDLACERKNTWVKFDSAIEKSTSRKVWKNFDRWTDASPKRTKGGGINYPDRRVEILWIGLFQGIKPTYKIGNRTLSSGFGHMNGYDFQFAVQKIEEVNKIAASVPYD